MRLYYCRSPPVHFYLRNWNSNKKVNLNFVLLLTVYVHLHALGLLKICYITEQCCRQLSETPVAGYVAVPKWPGLDVPFQFFFLLKAVWSLKSTRLEKRLHLRRMAPTTMLKKKGFRSSSTTCSRRSSSPSKCSLLSFYPVSRSMNSKVNCLASFNC